MGKEMGRRVKEYAARESLLVGLWVCRAERKGDFRDA